MTDCGYFDWLDPPMCARSVQIIPGLLTSRNVLEESLRSMAAANGRLKMCLVLSWVFFSFLLDVISVVCCKCSIFSDKLNLKLTNMYVMVNNFGCNMGNVQ